jgi:N-acetylglucosamine-6-phosphate deacetylase
MKDVETTSMLLRGARLVLPNGVVEGESVLVDRGLIARLGDENLRATAEQTWDLSGFTLFPGFIDVHIHGALGVDMMEASAADIAHVSQFLATKGVTAWLPTLVPGPIEDYVRSVKAIDYAMQSHFGARVLGVHYEGPFVNSGNCGALRTQYFRTYSGVNDLDDLPVFVFKAARHMMTVAPEIAGGIDLVKELSARGWVVSIGHTQARMQQLDAAFAAGARHMTHFMNAMAPLHHRSPGPIAWGLSRDDITCDIIADGIHLDLDMLRVLVKLKSTDNLSLISDAVAAAGMGDGQYEMWGETISVKNGRTANSRDAIAGSVITMYDAVRVMHSLGIPEVDLAKMASANPARLLGIDDECGSIEEGKRADLLALDAGGRVRLTMVGGRLAFHT